MKTVSETGPGLQKKLVFQSYGIVAVETDQPRIRMDYVHMHPEIEINLLEQGSAKYFFRDKIIPLPRHRLLVFWGSTPHCLFEASDNVKLLVAKVPLELFLEWQMPENFIHALLKGIIVTKPNDNDFINDRKMILQWKNTNYKQNPSHQHLLLMEAEALLFRLALNFTHSKNYPVFNSSHKSIEKVAKMLEFMAAHHEDPIHLSDIAGYAKCHPGYATTLFKKTCGISVQKYLIQLRLSHAESKLITSDQNISTIALDVGFASPCQFYAEFRKKHNTSPGTFRKKIVNSMNSA
jgi:AraC-like DNA-binding protein